MMRRSAIIVALFALCVPCSAVPYLTQVSPTADAVVFEATPSDSFGKGGALAVCGSASLNPDGNLVGIIDSFVRFNMSALVAELDTQFGGPDWIITGATLRLNEQARPNNEIYGQAAGLFEVRWLGGPNADTWPEGTGTPKTPTTDGVVYSDEGAILSASDLSLGTFANYGPQWPDDFVDVLCGLDLLAPFIDDIRAGGDVSFFLTAADDAVGFQFGARENKTADSRPYLIIEADAASSVPEPATLSLLALGLLAGLRRRRR